MARIFVLEDGQDFRLLIRKALPPESYDLVFAASVSEGLDTLSKGSFDLAILDISLPDGDGFEVCAHIQAQEVLRSTPVVFLTAHEDVSQKVAAFALGAEDYIVKPFNLIEFRARVDAKLRSRKSRAQADPVLVRGMIRINILEQKASITRDGVESDAALTPLEFKILVFLARNEEKVLSREQILQSVWGPNVHVFDRTVDTHISALRKKISPCGTYIQAVLGSGYCFSSKKTETKVS